MKLSIGSAQFGFQYGICNKDGIVKKKEVKKILQYCKSKKINSIDTAQEYGKSHRVLGSININKFQITSKISNLKKIKKKKLEDVVILEINKILKELNVNKLYALLIHNTSKLKYKSGHNLFEVLHKLKKKKKFTKLGVSVYTRRELDFVMKNYKIDIVNLPISVANQDFYKKNYLSKIKNEGIEIHARSIFLQGLLLSNYNQLPKKFRNNKFFKEWFSWLKMKNYNALDASLSFIKEINHIDKIVIGVDNLDQLKKIFKSYKKKLKYKFIKFKQIQILRNPSKW